MPHLPPGFKPPNPKEAEIEDKVKTFAKDLGWEVYKWSSPSNRGVLDDLFFHEDRIFIIIEFKRLGRKPSPKQQEKIDNLSPWGHEIFVIDKIIDGKQLIWLFTPGYIQKEFPKKNPFKG